MNKTYKIGDKVTYRRHVSRYEPKFVTNTGIVDGYDTKYIGPDNPYLVAKPQDYYVKTGSLLVLRDAENDAFHIDIVSYDAILNE